MVLVVNETGKAKNDNMKREESLKLLADEGRVWDMVIIGGGATGLGCAVDAVLRGYSVALFEQDDFAKGTSSRSTKLVHGGVRYLQHGDVALVFEALRERGRMKANAPHLVKDQAFVISNYRWRDNFLYFCGLAFYDLLSLGFGYGRSRFISAAKTARCLPVSVKRGLKGGIVYHDGQFDDSRLAINMVRSSIDAGACILNYAKVIGLLKDGDHKVSGVTVRDEETGTVYQVRSRCVINATGVFADEILQMDEPGKRPTVRPSQGVHLVLDSSFLQSDCAIMIPKTSDGRVLFAVPWHDKVVVGTTDTLMESPEKEPVALEKEIQFILDTAANYLTRPPKRSDVLSVFAGLRPLAAPRSEGKKTKEISRSHKLIREKSGLITIIGGKWTTYRKMAQDTLDLAIRYMHIPTKDCITERYQIHGSRKNPDFSDPLYVYGTDADEIRNLVASSPAMAEKLHPDYAYTVGEVTWLVRNEMPRTLEDVLARRLRILFLDARAAMAMAPKVAGILATEWGKDETWTSAQVKAFNEVASNYILN